MTRNVYKNEKQKMKANWISNQRVKSISNRDGQVLLAGKLASAGKVMPGSTAAILYNLKGSTKHILKHFQILSTSTFATTFTNKLKSSLYGTVPGTFVYR